MKELPGVESGEAQRERERMTGGWGKAKVESPIRATVSNMDLQEETVDSNGQNLPLLLDIASIRH